jgi:hypothetical protein
VVSEIAIIEAEILRLFHLLGLTSFMLASTRSGGGTEAHCRCKRNGLKSGGEEARNWGKI